jgi:small-conductance mechanosensitive channel
MATESANRKAKVEQLKQDDDVRRALEQTGEKRPKKVVEAKQKVWIAGYVILLFVFAAAFYLLRLNYFDFAERYVPLLQRLAAGGMAIVVVLAGAKLGNVYLVEPVADVVVRYNLKRVVNLLAGIAILFIVLSVLFANWYTAVVSLGLISLVLGFALQAPITSFIGWIYILIKAPYRVGDRIRMGDATGDVIDVNYLDTTLWEVGGEHVSTYHPSGRLIKFANSNVLNKTIFNYSWPLFPYIWNDIKFQIAYQSDLEFVAKVLRETAQEEVGEMMMEHVRTYRELLKQTPVDELEVSEYPAVVFRIGDNTWVEAIVRYVVEPRQAGPVKTRLLKKMLERLNAEPDKVMFPKGDSR